MLAVAHRCWSLITGWPGRRSERTNAGDSPPVRPALPGALRLHARQREETAPKSGEFKVVEHPLDWKVAETAIIICDMWEDHPCQMSAHRVDVMAPEVNRVISAARSLGVQIIHAPSDGMPHYASTPARLRMERAPSVKPPFALKTSCLREPEREAEFPIPETTTIRDGCDDPVYGGDYPSSRRQHPAIKIVGYDGVSDKRRRDLQFLRAARDQECRADGRSHASLRAGPRRSASGRWSSWERTWCCAAI